MSETKNRAASNFFANVAEKANAFIDKYRPQPLLALAELAGGAIALAVKEVPWPVKVAGAIGILHAATAFTFEEGSDHNPSADL